MECIIGLEWITSISGSVQFGSRVDTPILNAIGRVEVYRVWLEKKAVRLPRDRANPELLQEEVLCWHSEQIWLKVQENFCGRRVLITIR